MEGPLHRRAGTARPRRPKPRARKPSPQTRLFPFLGFRLYWDEGLRPRKARPVEGGRRGRPRGAAGRAAPHRSCGPRATPRPAFPDGEAAAAAPGEAERRPRPFLPASLAGRGRQFPAEAGGARGRARAGAESAGQRPPGRASAAGTGSAPAPAASPSWGAGARARRGGQRAAPSRPAVALPPPRAPF